MRLWIGHCVCWIIGLLSGGVCFSADAALTGANWMGTMADQTPLSILTIPGTHDSGARYEVYPGSLRCQRLTIRQQLDAGVRFLDIRCCHREDAFEIYHGPVYQHQDFDDVLRTVSVFLAEHPGECVLMSVKEEHEPHNTTRSFEATFQTYAAWYRSLWYLSPRPPTLGQARGKVVLLRRFWASSPLGIDARTHWRDNTAFTVQNDHSVLHVQDCYRQDGPEGKWQEVTSLLEQARKGPAEAFYLNFTSGYRLGLFGIPSVPAIAKTVNRQLDAYFHENPRGRFGILIMDFVTAERSERIWQTNFHPDSSPSADPAAEKP